MNKQKKFEKKKDREREVRRKVLRRREKLRAEAKEEATKERAEREHQRDLNRFKRATVMLNAGAPLTDEQIRERLAHNLEVLKALEEEHDRELKAREENARN